MQDVEIINMLFGLNIHDVSTYEGDMFWKQNSGTMSYGIPASEESIPALAQ